MIKRTGLLALIIFLLAPVLNAQITPPGLGKTSTASWFAIALQQDIDTVKNFGWLSMTYAGIGRMSNPGSSNPVKDQGIFILNQEFKNHFSPRWEYSLALSYRRQDEYLSNSPYEHGDPQFKQEFRLYGRVYYLINSSFVSITPIFRQEVRKFFNPDFSDYSEDWQLRSRVRLKLDFPLSRDKRKRIIFSSEQLFSTSKVKDTKDWTRFKYKESRFSIYYSYTPRKAPLTLNLGYMNNLIGTKSPYSGNYFAFDMVFKNLLKKNKK